jgi:Carboxypeptidase regulatory-like domain
MRKSWSVLLAVILIVKMSAAASAASVGGTMASSQGQPLTGVQVIVKDASGHVIGQGAPGSGGGYNIQGLQPGNYNFTLDPGSSGYQGQTVASYVGPDGICLNWGLSTTSPAVATAQPGTTCDPPAAAAAWDPAPWVGAGAVLVGGTAIGVGVGLGSGSDHGNHKTPPSTGE